MNKTYHTIERVNDARAFLGIGFKDYLAARVLLNNGLLLEGMCLASTSIEKYFKAILALRETVQRKHLNNDLLKAIKAVDPDLFRSLNESFLILLEKCYRLRYLGDLPNGYSVALIQYPSLAELDYSVSKIESQFSIFQDGTKLELSYQLSWKEKDSQLIENNYIFNGLDKRSFIENTESKVYCIRIQPPPSNTIEVTYTASKQPHDGNFLRELSFFHKPTNENPNTGIKLPFPYKIHK